MLHILGTGCVNFAIGINARRRKACEDPLFLTSILMFAMLIRSGCATLPPQTFVIVVLLDERMMPQIGKDMGTGYPPWVVGMGTYGYG